MAYQEIKNGRNHKKRNDGQIKDRKKEIRRDQLRSWVGRNANFVEQFTNQESVLHMGMCAL